jgi:ATP-dependent exoDNAse (exonuclease V) alpha subunit
VVCAVLPTAIVPVGTIKNQKTLPTERRKAMAIYHLSIKIISRGKGKSAVAAAAYRAGEKITNEYDGITHDFTRKSGVAHTTILLPENAPMDYQDRAVLWNAVEKIEKAKNSQLAREIEIALPVELSLLQNKSLVREYVKRNFVEHGMCADVCIHDTGNGNPHAHIMLTMRPISEDGTWGAKSKKSTFWTSAVSVSSWRAVRSRPAR